MEYAQVIDEGNGGVYNRSIIEIRGERRDRMPGEILVRKQNDKNNTPAELYVLPLFSFISKVPLYGEIVLITQLPNGNAVTKHRDIRWYYISTTALHGSRNINILPWIMNTTVPGSILSSVAGITGATPPEQNSFSEKTTPNLQPYEGDLIINDRFGSSIRFTSGVDKIARSKNGSKLYSVTPPWDGPVGDPLLVMTTGNAGDTLDYTVENFDDDSSSIIMSTSQKIDINTAHDNIGVNATPIKTYNKPQIILNSDRIILNSKQDDIVISGKSTVSIVTPNWAADMDRFFSLVEDLHTEVKNLQSQVSSLTTQVSSLATNISTYGTTQTTAIAAAPILAPLAPANATIVAGAASILSQTSIISSQLLKINSNLQKVDSNLSTLKQ